MENNKQALTEIYQAFQNEVLRILEYHAVAQTYDAETEILAAADNWRKALQTQSEPITGAPENGQSERAVDDIITLAKQIVDFPAGSEKHMKVKQKLKLALGKQNAENLTDTPEHVKENENSLQVIEGLDDAVKLAVEALELNHDYHKKHDEYDDYGDCELCEKNMGALAKLKAYQALCDRKGE